MLDDIKELRTFVRIAAEGSLSAAAREMGLALSVVSKRLAALEARVEHSPDDTKHTQAFADRRGRQASGTGAAYPRRSE
ncbi:LysR family transcriptional regulator [Acetobacter sacchari]|uniref:LysR family transcriptional regulator n=1 Tax=Acetobacter sacchari TaxID=2661687 RepID=A0ABS3LW39_9PROT|nr:LysR family transcriptional regulator [Acetobacter sacchari]MBO1360113.1 LysR family transcriptional regulator [Acetobacter sacchari]